jgi:hypothetical protein
MTRGVKTDFIAMIRSLVRLLPLEDDKIVLRTIGRNTIRMTGSLD